MPDPAAIARAPDAVPFPSKEEVLWSITLTLASRADKKNVEAFARWLKQGPAEFYVLFARLCFDTRYRESMPVLNKVLQDPMLKSILQAR